MPSQKPTIGPYQAIYVADAPSGSFLQVNATTTGPQKLNSATEETFLYSKNNSIQSGPRSVSCELTFLGDDPYVNQLANGNSLSGTLVADASSSFQNYSLLLIAPDVFAPSSIYIPVCHTLKKYELTSSKTAASALSITFGHQEIDRSGELYYKRDVPTLQDILGVRSPF